MAVGTKAQVAKGAKFLDEKSPGWAEKINTKKLAMVSNTHCILGQLGKAQGYKGSAPAFEFGEDLGLTESKFISYGFEADGSEDADKTHAELWKAEIEKRLPAKEPVAAKKTTKKKTAKV